MYYYFTSLVWVPFVPHLCEHNVQLDGTHLGGHGSIEHDCDCNGSKPGSQSSADTGVESFFWAHQTFRVLVPIKIRNSTPYTSSNGNNNE